MKKSAQKISQEVGLQVVQEIPQKKKFGDEEIFIDRDGFLFRYILLYLRTRELHIEKQHLRSLRTEAEFYQIPSLLSMINTMISKEELKESRYRLD